MNLTLLLLLSLFGLNCGGGESLESWVVVETEEEGRAACLFECGRSSEAMGVRVSNPDTEIETDMVVYCNSCSGILPLC